jgi:hypothetical protein
MLAAPFAERDPFAVPIWSKVTAITATLHATAHCREHTMFGTLPEANAEG